MSDASRARGRMTALGPNDDAIRVAALASGLVAIPAFELGIAGRLRNAT